MNLLEVGKVEHSYSDDEVRDNAGDIDGVIRVFDDYRDGLYTIDRYQYVFVIAIMHKHLDEKFPLRVKPRLLLRKNYKLEDLPEIGVFASDSPSRPNPLGLSLLKIVSIDGGTLKVSGLDLFDGTPVVDIKPYIRKYTISSDDVHKFSPEECADLGRH